MDRLAYHNMTTKNKTPSMPIIAESTTKAKINGQIEQYHFDQHTDYHDYVKALDNNISEDQFRTSVNTQRLHNEAPCNDPLQRVYHPSLTLEPDFLQMDRFGQWTRDRNGDRHGDSDAKTLTPLPKLGYPQSYEQMQPFPMDMTSHLDFQFTGLTDHSMDLQIARLNQESKNASVITQPQKEPQRQQIPQRPQTEPRRQQPKTRQPQVRFQPRNKSTGTRVVKTKKS
jgi:hypothetical protein